MVRVSFTDKVRSVKEKMVRVSFTENKLTVKEIKISFHIRYLRCYEVFLVLQSRDLFGRIRAFKIPKPDSALSFCSKSTKKLDQSLDSFLKDKTDFECKLVPSLIPQIVNYFW